MEISGLISLLIYLLIGGLIVYAVYWIIGMMSIPIVAKQIIVFLVGLAILLWLLRTFGLVSL